MTSGSTINVERVLAEEVDGEKTFVKRRERKEGCVEMAVVFRNTMGNEWGDEFANALIRFPSDLEVESQYVKEATSFPEATIGSNLSGTLYTAPDHPGPGFLVNLGGA